MAEEWDIPEVGDAANLGNRYTYCASDPWSLVDPFGLASGGNDSQSAQYGQEIVDRIMDSIFSSARNYWEFMKGFWLDGAGGGIQGLWQLYNILKDDPWALYETIKSTVSAIVNDPGGYFGKVLNEMLASLTDPRALGALTFDVLVTATGVGAAYMGVSRAGRVLKFIGKLGDIDWLDNRGAALNPFAPGALKRGNGGRGGGPDHAQVQQSIVDSAGGTDEFSVPLGDTGRSRIVDVMDSRGRYHQIGDMRWRGGFRPSAREHGAIEDLRKADPFATIIYQDKLGRNPSLINPDIQPGWVPAPPRHRMYK